MRCVYCYNPDIVLGKGKLSYEHALKFIRSRKGLLDGVVMSGGECTMHRGIEPFLHEVKDLGLQVKVDTNGGRPAAIKKLIDQRLIDYIALDYKSTRAKFDGITKSNLYKPFLETLNFLLSSKFAFEVRTTVHTQLLDESDLRTMASQLYRLGYRNKYYLQLFLNGSETLSSLGDSGKINPHDISKELEIVIRA